MSHQIEKSIKINAPLSRVWTALTDYRQFSQWFGVALDGPFEAGKPCTGTISFCGHDDYKFEVQVKEIQPETYFSYTWHPYAVDPAIDYTKEEPTLVEFRLSEADGATLLQVTESGFGQIPLTRREEAMRMNDRGWGIQVENIRNHVTSNP